MNDENVVKLQSCIFVNSSGLCGKLFDFVAEENCDFISMEMSQVKIK